MQVLIAAIGKLSLLVVLLVVSPVYASDLTATQQVTAAYQATLDRAPDAYGLEYWVWMRESQQISLSEMWVRFLLCDEYRQIHSIHDRDGLIQSFYAIFLDRDASEYELAMWSYWSIEDVARKFVTYAFGQGLVDRLDSDVLPCMDGEAAPAIEAFVASVDCTAYLSGCVYKLNTNIRISNKDTLTITTTSGKATLQSGATNIFGPLLHVTGTNRLTIDSITVDGNISGRRDAHNNYWNTLSLQGTDSRNSQANAIIDNCDGCKIVNSDFVNSVGASGLIIWGKDCTIDSCSFADNGYGLNISPSFGEWADGLTIVSGEGFAVTNNQFRNNSDISLVCANIASGTVSNNTFIHDDNWAFAAIGVTNFDNNDLCNCSGAVIADNTIDCTNGMCGIGISIGPYLWATVDYMGNPLNPIYGGTFRGNNIVGARQGIAIMGARKITMTMDNCATATGGWQLPSGYVTSSLADDLHLYCTSITDLFFATKN